MEIINLPEKKFNVMVIKMLTELRRRMGGHSEIFNKEIETVRKSYRAEEYNHCTEKYTREVQ